jgi:hypothetical protein
VLFRSVELVDDDLRHLALAQLHHDAHAVLVGLKIKTRQAIAQFGAITQGSEQRIIIGVV